MKIYSWNVNSLRSCENNFLEFVERYKPDIVGIQELRANPDQLSFFLKFVDGYRNLYPIPSTDLGVNPNLKQNTGY